MQLKPPMGYNPMPSRLARKRHRRREARLKATAPGPNIFEAWGWGTAAHRVRGDLQLVRQAIRDDWPTSPSARQAIVEAVGQLFDRQCRAPDRTIIAAVRTAIAMEAFNQREQRKAPSDGPTARFHF